jgi:hypothetical protein
MTTTNTFRLDIFSKKVKVATTTMSGKFTLASARAAGTATYADWDRIDIVETTDGDNWDLAVLTR